MPADSPTNSLWVERYRPQTLEEMALDPSHRTLLASFIAAKEIPHLLFTGPPGSGKTTTAKILTGAMECDLMTLNASKDRGIDIIRDRVGTFAKVLSVAKWKVVFLDEADGMTPDAQNSLRNLMEDFHEQTRFIFTANTPSRIIGAIHSRCTSIEFGETPLKERILILQRILTEEKVSFELPTVLGYAERFRDLRKMIMTAQKSVLSNNGALAPATELSVLGKDLLEFILKNDWTALVTVASNGSFDHKRALTDMFWAVGEVPGIKKPATLRLQLAKAVHECQWTPDPIVFFLGTCAEALQEQS